MNIEKYYFIIAEGVTVFIIGGNSRKIYAI